MSTDTMNTPTPDADARAITPDEWRAIKAVVQAALTLPRAERAAFVEEACAELPRIRREVVSLLESPDTDPGDDDFLAPPVPGLLDAIDLEALARAAHAGAADGALAPANGDRATDTGEQGDASLDAFWTALADRYVMERRIGRGGMATVYLARDRRHDRPVAIKVLHPRLASVLGRERFLREIALTAALRHPHLLPLFDSGSEAGQLYFVMPYVAGETLRERLARPPLLPVADAVALAREIASALAHAHARGIVHRDVKPENVLLEPGDGPDARPRALVADFGIARAIEHDADALLTRTGFAIGTPRYMAPEQARGDRDVDARADVYALGAVLHEMLAGAPPRRLGAGRVDGGGSGDGVASLAELRPGLPLPLVDVVTRAVAAEPAARFIDAAAFATALSLVPVETAHDSTRRPGDAGAAAAASLVEPVGERVDTRVSPAMARGGALWLVAATLAVGTIVGWQASRLRDRAATAAAGIVPGVVAAPSARTPAAPRTFVVEAGAIGRELPVFSPDGRTLVVSQVDGDGTRLVARPVSAGDAPSSTGDAGAGTDEPLVPTALAGTTGASSPFVSPTGAWIGFVADGVLRRVAIGGGPVLRIATLPRDATFGGATWSADDEIVFADSRAGALYRVRADGGDVVRVPLRDAYPGLRDPTVVDGRRIVLVTLDDRSAPRIARIDLASGALQLLGPGRTPRIVQGRLVFARADGTLMRQGFDMGTGMPVGEAEPIVSDVDVSPGRAAYSASASGALLYRVAERGAGDEPAREALRLTVRDRGGHTVQAIDARIPWTPRFSPDGTTLAYGAAPAGSDASELWTTTLATGATRQRTRDGRDANDPQWSPDGRAFAYSPTTPRGKRVVVESVDGGVPRALADVGGNSFPTGWTPDGRAVLATVDRGGNQDIVALPVDGGAARELLATSAHESGARLSRDGRWLAYQSDAGGPMSVYVRRADDLASPPIRVSDGGGVHPVWRRDGRELFYWERDRLMAVAVQPTADGRSLTIGEPTPLFRARYPGTLFAMYDVSPDGERIVVAAGGAEVERYRLVRIEGDARR